MLFTRLIRIGGFVAKEVREVVRQPRLLLSLLLGPFLILLIFGAGYLGPGGRLRAILVIPQALDADKATISAQFSRGVDVVDITPDLAKAKNSLRNGQADVVIDVPADAAQQIGAGAQATVPVFYNEVDPVKESQIVLGTVNYTNELNKETIAAAFKQSQSGAGSVKDALGRIDTALGQIDTDIAQGNVPHAQGQAADVGGNSSVVALTAGLLAQLLETEPAPATDQVAKQQRENLAQTRSSVQNLNSDVLSLQQELAKPAPDPTAVHTRTEAVRHDVGDLQSLTAQFQQMNPYVLAAPFYGKAENLAGSTSFINFYTPGVIALLLQHIAVTLGALSMVRERILGSVELFRVSPITPGEILTGKYLGFTIFLAVLAAALVALAVTVLRVPMLGDPLWLAISLLGLIFASLGLGFGVSMLSGTESQAVQLAMLTLLTSVFFGGFFLNLQSFVVPVQILSYALPVTHGIISLQDIMLRGRNPDLFYPGMLLALGILFAAFSMWRFSREFRRG
ncbi:MAG: ABC transporter permease [Chloroflexia bacterium]